MPDFTNTMNAVDGSLERIIDAINDTKDCNKCFYKNICDKCWNMCYVRVLMYRAIDLHEVIEFIHRDVIANA